MGACDNSRVPEYSDYCYCHVTEESAHIYPTLRTFFAPDEDRFPATRLARQAAEAGGAAPAVLNAANEIAVAAFLKRQIVFSRIAVLVESVLEQGDLHPAPRTLEEVLRVDEDARTRATRILEPA